MRADRISRIVLGVATIACLASAPSAGGEIVGSGPDESISQAFGPLTFGVTYSGAFSTPDDVDYLSFTVTAGQSIHVTVSNTLRHCVSPDDDACPVYATLMDGTDQQVGGSASSAGTIATTADTETINWTFASGGTYYVVMESNGNLTNGSPTYTVRIDNGPSVSGTGQRILRSLTVPAVQHGYAVKGRYVLAQRAALVRAKLSLLRSGHAPTLLLTFTRHGLRNGPHALMLTLPAVYRQAIKSGQVLKLRLKLTVVTTSGFKRTYTRGVTLSR
jgi:hypothetical protein